MDNLFRNERLAASVARYWGKSLEDREWYKISDQGDSAEVAIYDVIGWPFVSADAFVRELNGIKASAITVRMNSPGGDVFDGTAIYNALKTHPATITVKIDGVAASIASIIAMGADKVEIAPNAYFMIHEPYTIAIGDEAQMGKYSEMLGRIADTLADTYAEKTGKTRAEVRKLMKAETWYVGKEAKAAGFADSVTKPDKATALSDLSMFSHAPTPSAHESIREYEALLRSIGLSGTEAKTVASKTFTLLASRDGGVNDVLEPRDGGVEAVDVSTLIGSLKLNHLE